MNNQEGARKQGGWLAVSTCPDVCKTPLGSNIPPVPYSVTSKLKNAVAITPTVRFNKRPSYVLDRSKVPTTLGDQAGSAKGVKSGTVGAKTEPTSASSTVRSEKNKVVRHGDTCTLNDKNTDGKFVHAPPPAGASAQQANPAAQVENMYEKGLAALKETATSAATAYKDGVSDALHDFGGRAMDSGGSIAAGGGATASVGGAMVATGVGAVPGAVLVTAGGATATVGGAVAGVGGVVDSAATGLDSLAAWVAEGKTPNVLAIATSVAQRVVMSKVEKVLGALGKGKSKPSASETKGKGGGKDTNSPTSGPAGGGVGIAGSGGEGDCGIKPYKDQKCLKGQQAHHIVPDYTLRYGSRDERKKGLNGIPGMPSIDDGPSICLTGNAKGGKGEHEKAHQSTDPKIQAAGARTDNGPLGTAPIGEVIEISIDAMGDVKPRCKEEIKKKVDEAFKGVDRSKPGRTTQPKPDAKTTEALGGPRDDKSTRTLPSKKTGKR